MVRFSSSLEDKQAETRKKYELHEERYDSSFERQKPVYSENPVQEPRQPNVVNSEFYDGEMVLDEKIILYHNPIYFLQVKISNLVLNMRRILSLQ